MSVTMHLSLLYTSPEDKLTDFLTGYQCRTESVAVNPVNPSWSLIFVLSSALPGGPFVLHQLWRRHRKTCLLNQEPGVGGNVCSSLPCLFKTKYFLLFINLSQCQEGREIFCMPYCPMYFKPTFAEREEVDFPSHAVAQCRRCVCKVGGL